MYNLLLSNDSDVLGVLVVNLERVDDGACCRDVPSERLYNARPRSSDRQYLLSGSRERRQIQQV